ncbi:low-affinity Zn(2+) transporter zrt2 [Coemansia aciculifera]|nr:low-affinity Zn(2+) transporter zrt2 [Coemansia aciculifera]
MLFPVYSRAFNASRMMLPPPAVSTPVHPFVLGTSTMSPASRHVAASALASRTGFALSKYGNYAAVVQSRQHLAMMQSDQASRYLYSDPQFPLYLQPAANSAAACWPMPPSGFYDSSQLSRHGLAMRGSAQAKSTPELMRKYPKPIRLSNAASLERSASDKHTSSSSNAAISLRPNSFTNQIKRGLGSRRNRRADIESGLSAGLGWRHRCLSMPRLPPTTLDAGMCESLLDPAPPLALLPHGGGRRRSNRTSGSESGISPQSLAVALSAKRRSLQSPAHRRENGSIGSGTGARSSLGDVYDLASPNTGRLDTVPETDDSWTTSMPPYYATHNEEQEEEEDDGEREAVSSQEGRMHTYATTVSGGYATALTGGRPPSGLQSSRQATQASGRTQKRVSIPTPPLPAASAFASVNTGLPPSRNSHQGAAGGCGSSSYVHIAPTRAPLPPLLSHGRTMDGGKQAVDVDDNGDDQDSTAIHSKHSLATGLTYPVEVKRRALATYVLELGIALYSVLIGLALAISDRGFIALFLAVCFHQFFEGLALGTSLAELYWIKAQIAAQFHASELHAIDSESLIVMPSEYAAAAAATNAGDEGCHKISLSSGAVALNNSQLANSSYHMVNGNVVGSTTFSSNAEFSPTKKPRQQGRQSGQLTDDDLYSADFEYCSPDRNNRRSKSRRTLASMATSFTPEPWQVNPQLEKTLGTAGTGAGAISAAAVAGGGGNGAAPGISTLSTASKQQDPANKHGLAHSKEHQQQRYLRPRSAPERLPGWWKAWLSALAFTMTTPTGIIIGLAVRHVYEPHSSYALLFNGVLQSICTGVLVYAGLVTLMIGGFNSVQVKRLPRMLQMLLFFAVYAGAAVMASLKIWK